MNDVGEVFVIFPRKALAKELRICEQRVTAAFRKLAELQLCLLYTSLSGHIAGRVLPALWHHV